MDFIVHKKLNKLTMKNISCGTSTINLKNIDYHK